MAVSLLQGFPSVQATQVKQRGSKLLVSSLWIMRALVYYIVDIIAFLIRSLIIVSHVCSIHIQRRILNSLCSIHIQRK